LVYTDAVNLLGENINTTNRNTEAVLDTNEEYDVTVNAQETCPGFRT
jgi:hypothetical protein